MTTLSVPNAWIFFMLGFMNYVPTHGSISAAICAFKETQTLEEKAEVTDFLRLAAQSGDEVIKAAYAELDPITYQHLPYLEPIAAMHIGFWDAWQKCP